MKFKLAGSILSALLLAPASFPAAARPGVAADESGPVELRVDNLSMPLGIDDPAPRFSWQLKDPARGALQTAYEVQIASSNELLSQDKPDIWDSGRIKSGVSLNIQYAGPALHPSTRYYWRVKLWGAADKPYEKSRTSWWETGLLTQDAWRASWIGYETPEESAVRHAPAQWIANPDANALAAEKLPQQRIAYRQAITLSKPIKSAALFATGQDTVSAWINGEQVLTADAFPPWGQMPWKKFVRADATGKLAEGANTIAIETLHYVTNPAGAVDADAPPMIATLVVEYADGSTADFASDPTWKSATHAPEGWTEKSFDDSAWKPAVVWMQQPGPESRPLGHPWIPDSVKAMRHDFEVASPIRSARLYATALGAYELYLNGKRVGDDVLAPGWTDYREHVKYQTYDVTPSISNGKM